MADVGQTVVGPGGEAGIGLLMGPGWRRRDKSRNTFSDAELAKLRDAGAGPEFTLESGLKVLNNAANGKYAVGPDQRDIDASNRIREDFNNWDDSVSRWVTGPGGYGPAIQRQMGADYGANMGRGGGLNSDLSNSYSFARALYDAKQTPTDDPAAASQGLIDSFRNNWQNSGSIPQGQEWVAKTQAATGRQGIQGQWATGLGLTHLNNAQGIEEGNPSQDLYGQRGLLQMAGLTNNYESQLNADIDRENSVNLAGQLSDTRRLLGSAGLGSSGAGQRAMLQSYQAAQEQGQRDKIRTMSQIRDANMGRMAGAVQQGTGIGADMAAQQKARLAQANELATNLSYQGRTTEQAQDYDAYMRGQLDRQGWMRDVSGKQLDLQAQLTGLKGQQDFQQYALDADMAKSYEDSLQRRLALQNQSQQYGIGAQSAAWSQVDDMGRKNIADLLQMGDRFNAYEADKNNQMLQAGMAPLDFYKTLLTGIQQTPQRVSRPSPWMTAGANAAANYGASLFGGATNYAAQQAFPGYGREGA